MKKFELGTWSEFEGAIQKLGHEREERAKKSSWPLYDPIFRGLGSSKWGLETTLELSYPSARCDETLSLRKYYRKISAARPAIETFGGGRWDKVPTFPEFDELLKTDALGWLDMILIQTPRISEYFVYLRHHGFPSPLLDWTASPYVAAFFAFDSPPKEAEQVCIYGLLRDQTAGSSDAHLFVIGPNMHSHPRHLLQQCRYSMCVRRDSVNHDYLFQPHQSGLKLALGPQGELFKITIPIKERLTALRQLELMNINAFSLFGSEDSLIRTVARRELLFHDWK
jgi:hypothetical protein